MIRAILLCFAYMRSSNERCDKLSAAYLAYERDQPCPARVAAGLPVRVRLVHLPQAAQPDGAGRAADVGRRAARRAGGDGFQVQVRGEYREG